LQWAYGVALLSAATDIRSHLGEQLFDFCQLSDRLLFVTNQRIIQVKAGGSNAAPGRWGSVQFELPLDSIIAVCTEGNKLTVELDASADGVAVGSCAKFFGKKQGSSMVQPSPPPHKKYFACCPQPAADFHIHPGAPLRPEIARAPAFFLRAHVGDYVHSRRHRILRVRRNVAPVVHGPCHRRLSLARHHRQSN
jgi:hypothetical protein